MQYVSESDIKLPKQKKSGKKGDNGKVLVVGGSKDYAGAVALAGLASLRSGCDWATVAAPEKVAWAVNCLSPDLITVKLKGDYFSLKHAKEIIKLSEKHHAVLVGNGIGLKTETKKFIKKIIRGIKGLKVIDADAIKILSSSDLENSIITPHAGEMRLFMQNSKIKDEIAKIILNEKNIGKKALLIRKAFDNAKNNFFEKNNVMLLKGPVAIIISKKNIYLNNTGSPGMTKAGTGDVLAGLAAGFLAQSRNLRQSAINASYFGKIISDILSKKKKGFTFLASDMVNEIERILKRKIKQK